MGVTEAAWTGGASVNCDRWPEAEAWRRGPFQILALCLGNGVLCRETLGHDAKDRVLFGNALALARLKGREEREGSSGVRSM